MSTNTAVGRSGRPAVVRLVGAVAISSALAAVGYGAVEMATHFLQVPAQATASVAPAVAIYEPQFGARAEPLASAESARAPNAAERIDGPRECALDKGISEACTFQ